MGKHYKKLVVKLMGDLPGAPRVSKAFFNSVADQNWDMTSVDRSFDPNKVEEYLSLLDEPDRSLVDEILRETIYVPFPQFKAALFQSFEMFRQEIGPEGFYLMMAGDKIGSEHWLTALLWPQLRSLNLIEVIDYLTVIPVRPTNILMIDDAIYSGHRVENTIDEFTSNIAYKAGRKNNTVKC